MAGVGLRVFAHPVVAARFTAGGIDHVDIVRAARGPIVTGAFAIVVLPGRTQPLSQFAWISERTCDDRLLGRLPGNVGDLKKAPYLKVVVQQSLWMFLVEKDLVV